MGTCNYIESNVGRVYLNDGWTQGGKIWRVIELWAGILTVKNKGEERTMVPSELYRDYKLYSRNGMRV